MLCTFSAARLLVKLTAWVYTFMVVWMSEWRSSSFCTAHYAALNQDGSGPPIEVAPLQGEQLADSQTQGAADLNHRLVRLSKFAQESVHLLRLQHTRYFVSLPRCPDQCDWVRIHVFPTDRPLEQRVKEIADVRSSAFGKLE